MDRLSKAPDEMSIDASKMPNLLSLFRRSPSQPLISFIVPVLNADKDIARCLTAIRNQSVPAESYEILVVDNGSTDRTQQIVRSLGCCLEVLPGVNVSALRNHGAKSSHGKYLAFVDADVEIMSHWLQEGLPIFENTSMVAAGCFPRAPRPATWVQQTWELHQCGTSDFSARHPVLWLPSMNLIVRKDIFSLVNGFNDELDTAEDVDLCYRVGSYGTVLCVPAMEAVHWGEAPDLKTFFHKEAWRAKGNFAGVLAHGLRWDEIPSIGYPVYMLGCFVLMVVGIVVDIVRLNLHFTPVVVTLAVLPALLLALNTAYKTRRLTSVVKLVVLYVVYGMARACAVLKPQRYLKA